MGQKYLLTIFHAESYSIIIWNIVWNMEYCMEYCIIKLRRTFQNKKRTCFNKTYSYNKSFFQIYIQQGYGRTFTSKGFRSNRSQVFYKIDALENLAKFTGKHLCWRHKVAGLKRLHHNCFSIIFAKLLRAPYNNTTYTIKIAYG